MKKTIAAIISYNSRNFLPGCINSCLQSELDTLVIDNNSKDGSKEYLSSLKNITLIQNPSNGGFTQAANQAIEYALNHHYDYLLLLNQDTEFDVSMVPLLVNSIEADSLVAIVSPMQMNENNKPEYQFELNCIDLGIDINSPIKETIEVPFVNAACWLLDIKKIEQIGYLNPVFKNYGSDLNYCHKTIYAGFKVAINLKAIIIHKKRDKDYQKSFLKTVKVYNTYFLALLINPMENVLIRQVIKSMFKNLVSNFLKFNFKKVLLNKLTLIYLFLHLKEIRRIRATHPKS